MISPAQLDLQTEPTINGEKPWWWPRSLDNEDSDRPFGKCLRSVTRSCADEKLALKRVELRILQERYDDRWRANAPRCAEDDEFEKALSDFLPLNKASWKTKIEGASEKNVKPKKVWDRHYWTGVTAVRAEVKSWKFSVPNELPIPALVKTRSDAHYPYQVFSLVSSESLPLREVENLELCEAIRRVPRIPDRAQVVAGVFPKIPPQPGHLRVRGQNDLSYYDYRKQHWMPERTHDIPYKKDAAQYRHPVITKDKELITVSELDEKKLSWLKKHGHRKNGVWKFNDHADFCFQPHSFDTHLSHDNTDGSNDLVFARYYAVQKDEAGEKYNQADAYVIGYDDVFVPNNDGLAPIESTAGEKIAPEQRLFGDDAAAFEDIDEAAANVDTTLTAAVFKIIRPCEIKQYHDTDYPHYLKHRHFLTYRKDVMAMHGKSLPVRSHKDWKHFDTLSKKRRVNDLHLTDGKYSVYDNPIVLPIGRVGRRTNSEPVPTLKLLTKSDRLIDSAVLLLPPMLNAEEKQARRNLQKMFNDALRNNLAMDVEYQNRLDNTAFEKLRNEAISLRGHYNKQLKYHSPPKHSPWELPSDSKSRKYLASRDLYDVLANDVLASPSIDQDLGRCTYGPDIRGVYFSLHSKGSASQGSGGRYYDHTFPAPKQKKRTIYNDVSIPSGLKRPKGLNTTIRLLKGKITQLAAAQVEGVKKSAMKKRKQRLVSELDRRTASNYDFGRLSMTDLQRATQERGFYVVLPRSTAKVAYPSKNKIVRVQLADELIPVEIDGANDVGAQHAGLFAAFKESEILGGLQMEMSRELVRKIRTRKSRKADQDCAIRSAQKRLSAKFEYARLLYLGPPNRRT